MIHLIQELDIVRMAVERKYSIVLTLVHHEDHLTSFSISIFAFVYWSIQDEIYNWNMCAERMSIDNNDPMHSSKDHMFDLIDLQESETPLGE